MTDLTFQFVPNSHIASQDMVPEWDSGFVEKIDTGNELTIIHLCDGTQIEHDSIGNIRFSFDVDEIEKSKLDELLEFSRRRMDMACDWTIQSYTICLVLNDKQVSSVLLNNFDEITKFGKDEFNSPNPEYTEFGDQIIKVSFQDTTDCIAI